MPDYSHVHTTPYGFHKKPSLLTRALYKSMFYVRVRNQLRELRDKKRLAENPALENKD